MRSATSLSATEVFSPLSRRTAMHTPFSTVSYTHLEYAETLRRESLEQAAAAVASGSLRPREGGRASGGELLGTDPSHMTAAQRAELRDRIKRGERVYPRCV